MRTHGGELLHCASPRRCQPIFPQLRKNPGGQGRGSKFCFPRARPPRNPQTANAQQRRRRKALMRHTAASCFPSINKAHRREVDAHSAGQGGTRASPARLGATPVAGVDALRLPAMVPTWLAGQPIARSGQTGNVNTPQLHFQVRKGATPLDPMKFLNGA